MYLATYIQISLRLLVLLAGQRVQMTWGYWRRKKTRERERKRPNKLRQRCMTSCNQQRHVTAAESRRWRDVINRDFPRNVADRRRAADDKSRKVGEELSRTCPSDKQASELTNERQQSAPSAAAAADTVRVGRANHANALATQRLAWCGRRASSLLFR